MCKVYDKLIKAHLLLKKYLKNCKNIKNELMTPDQLIYVVNNPATGSVD